jgi:hypothetical protein
MESLVSVMVSAVITLLLVLVLLKLLSITLTSLTQLFPGIIVVALIVWILRAMVRTLLG